MMCSSTPLKKEISKVAVLIVQAGFDESTAGFVAEIFLFAIRIFYYGSVSPIPANQRVTSKRRLSRLWIKIALPSHTAE